jgi:hypothetical protein
VEGSVRRQERIKARLVAPPHHTKQMDESEGAERRPKASRAACMPSCLLSWGGPDRYRVHA